LERVFAVPRPKCRACVAAQGRSLRQPPAATLSPPCGPGPSVFTTHARGVWVAPRFPVPPAGGGPRRSRSGVARPRRGRTSKKSSCFLSCVASGGAGGVERRGRRCS